MCPPVPSYVSVKDIAWRVCEAFMAARGAAGITTLYRRGKHLDDEDRIVSTAVLDLVRGRGWAFRFRMQGLGF